MRLGKSCRNKRGEEGSAHLLHHVEGHVGGGHVGGGPHLGRAWGQEKVEKELSVGVKRSQKVWKEVEEGESGLREGED